MDVNEFAHDTTIATVFRLAFITNVFREPLLKAVDEEFGLGRPEVTILLCLSFRDGLIARHIWELTGQPRNSISRGTQFLETKGLIHRRQDPHDKRKVVLGLTAKGSSLVSKVLPGFEKGEAEMLSCLTPGELKRFAALLIKVVANVANGRKLD